MQLYDCDSCTGLDNSGAMKFDSDIEVVEGTFNTSSSRLWEKLRRNFPTQILAQWEYLRLNEFTEENIMKYLVDNISDKIPEVNYNKDAWKKYIQLGTSYLFACHGNRRQQIQRWIRERLIYVDTLLEYTVSTNDYLTVRVNKLGEVHFDIQTFQPMYFSIKFRNETGGTIRHRIGRGETVRFSYNIPVATDQEILVYGGRFVKDLGDLSEMNPTNLLLDRATRLTKIKCNDSPALINASISSCTMLQEVDLRNCSNLGGGSDASLQTLDLTQCRNLRFVDIFGTQLTALHTSKVGGIIQEIIYPYSVQVIDIANQSRLQSVGIPCYYTGDYQDENNIFAENLSEVTLSNCPNIISFVKNYCVDENGNEIPVPTFVGVSKGQMFNLSNTMTYLTQIDLSYCSNIISLTLDNFDKLVEINFDDISMWNATSSNLENLTLTNCPNVETLTFNQNTIDGNNSLGVAFKEGTVLDLSGLYNLKHIRSNVGVKGLKKLILPLTIQSLVFDHPEDTTYSLGDSDIESIFSKDAVHDNDGFSGIDLLNIQTITDFSMGSLTKMNNAINLDIKITNTFPYFNYFKTSDYFKPEGTVDITEYRDDLDYLFKGVDLNKLTIICDEPLPHTSASYMFAFATCQDTEVINELFDLMPNVTDFSYMFYNAYLKEAPYIPLRAENVSYMFYNNTVMESTPSNWLQSYIFVPNSAYCYTGCVNIKWIDGIEGSIDVIPSEWGGYERTNTTMTGENLVIEKTLEREIEKFIASGQSFHNVAPLVGQTPTITANESSQNIGQGLPSDILLNDGKVPYGELEGLTLVNLASERRSGELTTKKEKDRVSNVLPTTFKLDESKEMPVVRLEGSTLHNVANQDSKTPLLTNGNYGTFEIDENIDETTHIKDGKMYSTTLYGQTISNDMAKTTIKHELNEYEPNKLITQQDNKEIIYEYGNFENATLKGKTLVNIVQESSEIEYVITGDAFEKQSGILENTVEGNIKSVILKGRTEINDGIMQSVNLYPNQTVKKITWSSGRYYTEQGTLTSVNATANHKYFEEYFEVLPNHTLRVIGNNTTKYLNFYDESKTFISRATITSTDDLVAIVPSNARYYRYSMLVNSGMTDETVIYDEDMQINIADTSIEADYLQKMGVLQTSNEDGNEISILSVNEELKLRSNGEIYDELDLLNGKMIQRVDENNEVLKQEIIKTISIIILDQNDNTIENLHTFNITTHIDTYAQGNGLIPFVNIPEIISYDTGGMLKPNTTYTLQINRKESNYPFVIIIGGTKIEVQGNKAVFTTLSTITDTDIKFYGKNNIISKVRLIEGIYSNDVPYFEGMISYKKESDKKSILTISNYPLEENGLHDDFKMNILECDEEINLRRIGDVKDELNLLTGELTQRVGEVVFDGSEEWSIPTNYSNGNCKGYSLSVSGLTSNIVCDCLKILPNSLKYGTEEGVFVSNNLLILKKNIATRELLKEWLSQNPIIIQYQLATESIKTVDLKNKPSINWQGDTYLHLENNTLYPQLDCEVESINYYEIPKLKANTLYTLRYVGEPTQCIFGGSTYKTENNMVLTSGSSDNLLYFDKEVRKVILIEGDVRDRNFDYFEGIESLGAVEIVTHKSDMSIFSKVQLPPHIQLHKLPDGTCDELDIETGILTRRIDENYNLLEEEITEKLILNYNNSCNYGVILPRGTSDNYNVITNEYKQNLDFIPIDGSIAFDTATLKDTTVKFSVTLSKFEVDTTNVRGSDGIYCDNNLFKYEASDNDYEHAYIENDTTLHIYVNKSRLSSYDQVGFQLYLTNNPFDLYYAMKNPIISYVNYEDLDAEKASWEMLDCTEDGSITIESGNMDKTLLLDCMDYIAPTKNRFEIDLLKANTQYTVYAEGVSGRIQLNFGGNIVNFTSGNIYTSGETQLIEFYTDNEIKNLIIIEGDTRNETIEFFEGVVSSKNITVISSNDDESESNKISYEGITLRSLPNGVKDEINVLTGEYIQRVGEREYSDGDFEDENVLTDGAITLYELETQIIHQLDTQSLTPYQDGYISMEVETNYPSFIYSLPSTNAFYIPKIKNMTQYTLKYPVGKGTVTIGNIQYNVTSNSMLFTTPIEITGDKNSLIFETDDNPTEVMILEGNYSDREVKYFTGINSVINPVIRVTNSLTGGSVEYKGNSDIALYSLPNKMSDKLDVLTGYLMRVTGIREYQDGDYELDNVFTDGINTVYKLDSPLLYRNINFPIPTLNGYGTIELDSDEAIPQLNYRVLSNNYYPIELLEPNTTYTMIGEAQANTTFTLGGTYVGNYSGGKLVVNLGSVTENSLKFSNDIELKNFMLVKGDATNSTLPFYTGIKSVEDISFLIKGYDGQENNLVLDDSIVLRECGGVYDSIDLINYTMTKRLNEIVLVGTEYWSVETSKQVDSNYQLFSLAVTSAKDTRNAKIYCDKLTHKYLGNNTDCVYFENNKLYLCINKDTIIGDNVNALKVWLTKNNVKIIYPLINDVKLDLDVVWEITPPTSYETQTEFSSNVALGSLKPMLALTVATTTLEDVVSTLKAQNTKLEEENIATMLALTGIYETMVVPTIESGASTVNLSDGKDGNNMNGMSISPMGMIYAKLVKKGLKTIEQVPAHLQVEVKYVLKEDK